MNVVSGTGIGTGNLTPLYQRIPHNLTWDRNHVDAVQSRTVPSCVMALPNMVYNWWMWECLHFAQFLRSFDLRRSTHVAEDTLRTGGQTSETLAVKLLRMTDTRNGESRSEFVHAGIASTYL
jgi:hypothetical protein